MACVRSIGIDNYILPPSSFELVLKFIFSLLKNSVRTKEAMELKKFLYFIDRQMILGYKIFPINVKFYVQILAVVKKSTIYWSIKFYETGPWPCSI